MDIPTLFSKPGPARNRLILVALWFVFYVGFTLLTPPLLDDADSVHAEVAREMLLRHDWVTLYANGIRYLEKAPLLYWSMAASFKLFGPQTGAARLPLAFTVLALALALEAFARRAFASTRAGLYAALMILSSFGLFIFTRITIPDAAVCLWTTLALYCFWRGDQEEQTRFRWRAGFAVACALNVLTKGLIGVVFPVAIALLYLLLTRGLKGTWARFRLSHELAEISLFFLIAAPWHLAAGLANPTQGHPTPFHFVAGHWQVPLPTDGNVRGWFWFYFMNEHLLRYLNLRVPHDYDTAPLYLFWGLCFIWMMPWSAFVFNAVLKPLGKSIRSFTGRDLRVFPQLASFQSPQIFLILWAAFVLLFFTLSTRQEYYVLPALPALVVLISGWLVRSKDWPPSREQGKLNAYRKEIDHCLYVPLALGTLFALAATYFLLHTKQPAPNTDLATLLAQNPGDYA
ncbi:MAG: phospholipid carrier-dependent glycosyltransferase, partial [Edaphobacter sp.]